MRRAPLLPAALCAALVGAVAACPTDGDACRADDECPLDAMCAAGRCVPLEGEGEGEPPAEGEGEGEEPAEGEGEGEEPAEGEGEGEGEGEPPRCSLADGRLDVDELPIALGVPLRYLAATDEGAAIPVDVEGSADGAGRRWDFSGAVPGGAPFEVVARPLLDQWYAASFEDAPAFADGRGAYVAPLSDEIEGVLEKQDQALLLLGVASIEEGRTVVSYDPPITVLSFPLELGASFTTETSGSGTFEFNPFYFSSDVYSSAIDAAGVVATAAGDLPALRLRLEQQVAVGYLLVTQIKYSWLSPCIGVIAQVESDTDEEDPSFTSARHLRQVAAPGGG